MEEIQSYNSMDNPSSSFNLIVGKRNSGKSVIAEYFVKELLENQSIQNAYLFSKTDASFDIIKKDNRFETIEPLEMIINNYRVMNEFNKCCNNKDKFKIRSVIILDDFGSDMKSKEFKVIEEMSILGRHISYEPLSLIWVILSQVITMIPRSIRVNTSQIFFSKISSRTERDIILNEFFYIADGSREGRKKANDLYNELVTNTNYGFIVIENYRQNVTDYKDYIKTYRACLCDDCK